MRNAIIRIASITCLFATALAGATDLASANYRIKWDVQDGGGDTGTSTNFTLVDSIGQTSAVGGSTSAGYQLQAGFHSAPDTDQDSIRDFIDNCYLDPNPDQRDTNSDRFGNICDADLDNSGLINFADLQIMKDAFFSSPGNPAFDPDADLNGDDAVNFGDLFLMKVSFFGPPGPSGTAP